MAKKKTNIEIGQRAYEEVCRVFGNANKAAYQMCVAKQTIYDWRDGSAPGCNYLVLLHHFGCDVIYILSGRKNNEGSNY